MESSLQDMQQQLNSLAWTMLMFVQGVAGCVATVSASAATTQA